MMASVRERCQRWELAPGCDGCTAHREPGRRRAGL